MLFILFVFGIVLCKASKSLNRMNDMVQYSFGPLVLLIGERLVIEKLFDIKLSYFR